MWLCIICSHSLLDSNINRVLSLCHDQAILHAVQCIIQNTIIYDEVSPQHLSYLQSKFSNQLRPKDLQMFKVYWYKVFCLYLSYLQSKFSNQLRPKDLLMFKVYLIQSLLSIPLLSTEPITP